LSNRGCLINSSSLTSDSAELERLREQPGHIDGEVAESANRLLIPWFLCFRKSDLRPVSGDSMDLQLPCTTVEQAVRNLEQSLPVFEAIAGDAVLARPYWELACAMVRRLPLRYLTMDPTEPLQIMEEPPEGFTAQFAAAMSGDLAAIPHLKTLCGYDDSVAPYPIDILYSMPGGDPDEIRMWNASVLDGGFQPDFQYVTWSHASGTAEPAKPPPAPSSLFGELYDVRGLMEGWIKAEVPTAPGVDCGLQSGAVEQLQVDIYARSVADAKRLESSATLRGRLKALADIRLVPWCQKYGFGWKGFRFSSPDWAQS
jgi:hypothetical protein